MKLKPLVAATAMALASLSSQATSTDWGAHGAFEFGGALTGSVDLSDTYLFTLSSWTNLTAGVLPFFISGTFEVINAGANATPLGGDDTVIGSWGFGGGPIAPHSFTLAPGSYYYLVSGDSAPGAYLIGSLATPVPEPETYAMLLAGLGVAGFLARRRRPLD
jgi:hypothetical protein